MRAISKPGESSSHLPHTGTQMAVWGGKGLDLCSLSHTGTIFCYDTVLTYTDTVEAK